MCWFTTMCWIFLSGRKHTTLGTFFCFDGGSLRSRGRLGGVWIPQLQWLWTDFLVRTWCYLYMQWYDMMLIWSHFFNGHQVGQILVLLWKMHADEIENKRRFPSEFLNMLCLYLPLLGIRMCTWATGVPLEWHQKHWRHADVCILYVHGVPPSWNVHFTLTWCR